MKAETVSDVKAEPAALPTGPDEITLHFHGLEIFRASEEKWAEADQKRGEGTPAQGSNSAT